jgi:hypothetical protein
MTLEEYVHLVWRAYDEFQLCYYRQPAAILISFEDWQQLRWQSQEEWDELHLADVYQPARVLPQLQPYDTLLGLELRPVAQMPAGRVVLLGTDDDQVMRAEPTIRGTIEFSWPQQVRTMQPQDDETGAALERGRLALSSGVAAALFLAERRATLVASAALPPAVIEDKPQETQKRNPEDDVLDAIDLLVDQQLKSGPRDDYNVNRYPRCVKCHHDWHGTCCENCSCLGDPEYDPVTDASQAICPGSTAI